MPLMPERMCSRFGSVFGNKSDHTIVCMAGTFHQLQDRGGTMIATIDRRYRNWLAHMGLYYALRNDAQRSERLRRLVRRIDHSKRFKLQSLN
jgi:hypothetical protein